MNNFHLDGTATIGAVLQASFAKHTGRSQPPQYHVLTHHSIGKDAPIISSANKVSATFQKAYYILIHGVASKRHSNHADGNQLRLAPCQLAATSNLHHGNADSRFASQRCQQTLRSDPDIFMISTQTLLLSTFRNWQIYCVDSLQFVKFTRLRRRGTIKFTTLI